MKVTTIGSAASGSQLGRESSGYLLQNRMGRDQFDFMLDFGPALGALDGYLNPAALEGIIVTHGHPDHTNGFAHLLVRRFWNTDVAARNAFLDGARGVYPRIPVYGPPGLRETLLAQVNVPGAVTLEEAALDPHAECQLIGEEAIDELLEFHSLAEVLDGAGTEIEGNLRLTAIRAKHPVEAFSVRLDHPQLGSLCYTGDTGPSPELTELARDVDLLIYNTPGAAKGAGGRPMHSSPAEAGQCAADAGVKQLMLGHLNAGLHNPRWADGCNTPEQLRAAQARAWRAVETYSVRQARSTFDGRVMAATPGATVNFGRWRSPAPSSSRSAPRDLERGVAITPLRPPLAGGAARQRRSRMRPGGHR